MSRLLIIGASELQLPVILKARELGHIIAVADYDPKAVGIKYANLYFNASTIDIEAICDIAKRWKPDCVLTTATDMPVRSVAAATDLLNLPGISMETAIKATDKADMIKTFKEHKVDSPWYFTIEKRSNLSDILNQLNFPCIIKPTDNSGSRGVTFVEKPEKLDQAYTYSKKHSRSGKVIIEEYMTGNEVSVEVIVFNGKINILAVTDKLTTGVPHFVEMGHCQPSQLDQKDISKIKNLTIRAIQAIDLKHGAAHVEIMLTKDGPKIVELGARMGGDFITTHLVPLSTGIDMLKAAIYVALGFEPDVKPSFNKGSAIRYFKVPPGKISSISGIDHIKHIEGIKEFALFKGVGEKIVPIQCSNDRIGYVIGQGENANHAVNICEQALNGIDINIEN